MTNIKGFYFITDAGLSRQGIFADVKSAIRAGVKVVQYREKNKSSLEMYQEALQLRKICQSITFLVNDRIDLALAVDADGVHLGQNDIPYKQARRILGRNKIIGVTVHSVKEAMLAQKQGADYLGVSPIFATQTKKDAGLPKGINLIKAIKEKVSLPLVAIGGINLGNAPQVINAGADSLSAISAVLKAKVLKTEINKFQKIIGKLIFLLTVNLSVILLSQSNTFAGEALFYKEANLIGGYSTRDHWVDSNSDLFTSVGLEDFRKFSSDYGDFLTTDLQLRAAYDSTKNARQAWGLQIHNAWLKYKLLPWAKLVAGHFDPSFGLEPQLDTHSTILQTLMMENIGYKKDWGVGMEGSLSKIDYKTSLQIGSGMGIYRRDDSFLFTSRIGTPTTQNLQYGASLLYGKVLQEKNMWTFPRAGLVSKEATLKKRVGLDGQYLFGPYLFKAETAYGTDNHITVLGYLGELDYTLPKYQNWEFELQFQSWIHNLAKSSTDDSTLTLGTSYRLNQNITLRAAFAHDFHLDAQKKEDKVLLQFYYFAL